MFNPFKRPQISQLPEPTAESYRLQTKFSDRPVDIADKLPEPAREKLKALRDEAESARAAARAVYDRMREKRDDAQEIERKIREITQRNVDPVRETDPRLIAERENLARFLAAAKQLTVEHNQKREAAAPSAHTLARVTGYLETLGSRPVTLAPKVTTPALAKGETLAGAIEKARGRIAALKDELQDALDAPIPSSAAKAIARAHIERLAEQGAPNVLATIEGARPPEFATKPAGFGSSGTTEIDVLSLFAWMHKDALIAALESKIDAEADDGSALSDNERADKVASCKRKILALERDEEKLIEAARASGLAIQRRPDADVRALLNLADSAPEQTR